MVFPLKKLTALQNMHAINLMLYRIGKARWLSWFYNYYLQVKTVQYINYWIILQMLLKYVLLLLIKIVFEGTTDLNKLQQVC